MHGQFTRHIDRRRFLGRLGSLWLFANPPAGTLTGQAIDDMPDGSPDVSRDALYELRDYAERPVREFLRIHFAGNRAFTARGMDGKERLLTRRFRNGIYKYFERVRKSEKSLPMVADPFTGSMRAQSFSVGDAKVRSEKAWAPVTIRENGTEWTLTYLLRNDQERNDDRWRIDDIQDVRGNLLSATLKKL